MRIENFSPMFSLQRSPESGDAVVLIGQVELIDVTEVSHSAVVVNG